MECQKRQITSQNIQG